MPPPHSLPAGDGTSQSAICRFFFKKSSYFLISTEAYDGLFLHSRCPYISCPLLCMWGVGAAKTVRLLLRWGADPNRRATTDYGTPLHWACRTGDITLCTLLVRHGADCHALNSGSKTPIDIAILHQFLPLANFLRSLRGTVQRKGDDSCDPKRRSFGEKEG